MSSKRFWRSGVERAQILVLTALVVLGLLWPLDATAQRLPDTGQTKCYDNTEEIPCPQPGEDFYGQDAQYTSPTMAYRDNGDGTVTDLNTLLMWQQQEDTVWRTWQGAAEYCEGLSLGGHSDWRLPSIQELSTLIDSSKPYPGPAINTEYFKNCKSSWYWSSSPNFYGCGDVWGVDFDAGDVYEYYSSASRPARCVREVL